MPHKKTIALIILDGWGYTESPQNNAISAANKPTWDKLWQQYPHALLSASSEDVGLPEGQMGNSEVGHMTIGAGRIIYQDLVRINKSIENKTFFKNPELLNLLDNAKTSALHIFGLLSDGGVHSHIDHLIALLKLAKQECIQKVYIHAILDGRDTPPQSAKIYLEQLENSIKKIGVGKIATICGRFYAMDRDKRYERTKMAYELFTEGKAEYKAETALAALEAAYERGETDEFVKPTVINNYNDNKMNNGDCLIFTNFRSDRMRQIVKSLSDEYYDSFERDYFPRIKEISTFTNYDQTLSCSIIFPQQTLNNTLGQYLSHHNKTQLRIAETEKYAHVTFFFNGGIEDPYQGEERILIPSPKVATYDLQPEMSAYEVTENLIKAINSQKFDFIVCNFANPDMVGHTGNLAATVKAIETIDDCLDKIYSALQKNNGEALITADHGNAECMFDDNTKQPHTAHTKNLVPLLYLGQDKNILDQNKTYKLSDIAPIILKLLNLTIPNEMRE